MNWNTNEFVWLDWAVLAVGVVAIIWAVYHAIQKDKKKMKGADSQDYLFGKGEPWYIIGAAIFAANIGSEHLVGLAGTGAKDGVGMAHWEMQGWMILILGWLFVPFYQLLNNKLGKIITMPDFLKFRYTQRTGSWLSIITLIAYVLTKVSVTAFTGGIFFEYLLGLPFWYGAIGLIAITAVFTVFGGMKGVMTLSAIQTPILIIGSFLVLFLGLSMLGDGSITEGWSQMMAVCNAAHDGFGTTHMFHTDPADPMYPQFPGYVVFLGASIIGFWYWCTDQHIVQRVLGQTKGEDNAKVMQRARRGTIAAGYFKLLPVFMFLIPGMVAFALSQKTGSGIIMDITNTHDTDGAFAMMVKNILPAGVKGLVTVGFICALVASLAAFFNSLRHPVHRRLLQADEERHERKPLRLRRPRGNSGCGAPRTCMDADNDEHGQPVLLPARHTVAHSSCHGCRIHTRHILKENNAKSRRMGTDRRFPHRHAAPAHQRNHKLGQSHDGRSFLGIHHMVLANQLADLRGLVAGIHYTAYGCSIHVHTKTKRRANRSHHIHERIQGFNTQEPGINGTW